MKPRVTRDGFKSDAERRRALDSRHILENCDRMSKSEISRKIADAQTEIAAMLKQIQDSLLDCADPNNNWTTVGDTNRLRDDLKAILEYRK